MLIKVNLKFQFLFVFFMFMSKFAANVFLYCKCISILQNVFFIIALFKQNDLLQISVKGERVLLEIY